MSRKNTAFTKEFKLEALGLAELPNTCIVHLFRDLGIRGNMIYEWREPFETKKESKGAYSIDFESIFDC